MTLDFLLNEEISDYYEWFDASRALEIDDKIALINVERLGNVSGKKEATAAQRKISGMESQRDILLGDNKFIITDDKIKQEREKRRKQQEQTKITRPQNGGNSKGNSSKTESGLKRVQKSDRR